MSAKHTNRWGKWQDKLGETERKEETGWDRKLYGEMNAKRVEWFVIAGLVGLFMILVGIGMIQYVGKARRMAYVSNVNAIRTALQSSFTVHESELKRERETGDINFYISPQPGQIPDDENGAILRQDIDQLLISCGVYRYRISGLNERITEVEEQLETADAETEKTGWIFEIIQASGTLTIHYWNDYNNYEKKPDAPDCIFTVTGAPDSCLAALEGSYQ